MGAKLVLCDCEGSQTIDREALEAATGLTCTRVHSGLCTRELGEAAKFLAEGDTVIACGQETATFDELAEELEAPAPGYLDLRDRAGWTDEGEVTGPKMAALVADAMFERPAVRTFDVESHGLCLILGAEEVALGAAERLKDALSVTVLTEAASAPDTRDVQVITGRLRKARGSLGRFEVTIDALAEARPGGRGARGFGSPRDGAVTECDLILDLTGGSPLFPAPHKRDGYLRADPGDPLAVAGVVFEAAQMVGTFEKPLYIKLEEAICAHSRANQTACTNCLDICPTGAISSAGDHVAVDPNICAGCGACSALCPSGAITYDDPDPQALFRRIAALASAFRKAGGDAPRLLVHDSDHGREMISLAARYGRGLPGDVVPMDLETISGFGHAEQLAALGSGFARVDILLSPKTERTALEREVALTAALVGAERVRLLDPAEPDAMSDLLYGAAADAPLATPILPLGGRREVTRLAVKALRPAEDTPIPLPADAPYGAVLVNEDACTLCLSCASLCPSGALTENPDSPELRFQESACLQCGLCANICPESAITLEPRMLLGDEAFSERTLKQEEPYPCVECGALFGVKSTIERIVAQLEGKHPMFADSKQGRMIRMCDDCRVKSQMHAEDNPFAGAERPRPRTTDDYLN